MSDDPLLLTLMDPSNADVFGSRHVDVDCCRSPVLTLIDDQPQCLPGHCDIRNSPFLSCSNKTALHLFGLIEVTKNLVQIMSFFGLSNIICCCDTSCVVYKTLSAAVIEVVVWVILFGSFPALSHQMTGSVQADETAGQPAYSSSYTVCSLYIYRVTGV